MSSIPVRVEYRPVRIGWCVDSGSIEQVEKAIRLSLCLYGGQFNPIIPINSPDLGEDLIKSFKVDALYPLCQSETADSLRVKFPQLLWPGNHDEIFVDVKSKFASCTFLDVTHVFSRISKSIEYREAHVPRIQIFDWEPDDPDRYCLLAMLGGYPKVEECGIDYSQMLTRLSGRTKIQIPKDENLPDEFWKSISPATITSFGLRAAYGGSFGVRIPGIYIGNSDDFCDLTNYWNLRAAGAPLLFVPRGSSRYNGAIQAYLKWAREQIGSGEFQDRFSIYSSQKLTAAEIEQFGSGLTIHHIIPTYFNDLNFSAARFAFKGRTITGDLELEDRGARLVVPLNEKPFNDGSATMSQRFAVKIRPYGRAHLHLLSPPYVPQLNEFYGRKYYHDYDCVRSESDGAVIITHANDSSLSVKAIQPLDFFAKLFSFAGFSTKASAAGRITSQIISQFGGLQGGRVFKIPGVRSLIKKYRPDKWFNAPQAMTQIQNGLEAHQRLYLEPRDTDSLTKYDVFKYLQKKRVIQTGLEFKCTKCELKFWLSLDDSKSQVTCPYCEERFLSDVQLNGRDCWQFRRSGIFGRNDNQQGGIPVTLVLQQLDVNIGSPGISTFYPGLTLEPTDEKLPKCELDLVLITEHPLRGTQILFGECKDEFQQIEENDAKNLLKVYYTLEKLGLDPYILFAKTGPFSDQEIANCQLAQPNDQVRVILLSNLELEGYHISDGYPKIKGIERYASSLSELAENTRLIYFDRTQS